MTSRPDGAMGRATPSSQGAHSGVHRWPRLAHGAPTGRGRGADRDTRHPLPVSRAAPSRCLRSLSETVGRLGRMGEASGRALLSPSASERSWESQKPLATSLSARGRDAPDGVGWKPHSLLGLPSHPSSPPPTKRAYSLHFPSGGPSGSAMLSGGERGRVRRGGEGGWGWGWRAKA